jgi:anti-sigma factor RsiW
MTDHLSQSLLGALADGELSREQLAGANEHLAACAACTSEALAQSLLKSATARAGQRYAPPPDFKQRLSRLVREQSELLAQEQSELLAQELSELPVQSQSELLAQEQSELRKLRPSAAKRRPFNAFAAAGWATAALLLLAFSSIVVFQSRMRQSAVLSGESASESAALVTESCDEHIAVLAGNAPPQVISTDRHTVKPWFQGKIPFSFNLPENLPADTKLEGANLTYLHNQPAALLLYSIGKHRVSVFVRQRTGNDGSAALTTRHAGFQVSAFSTADLDIIAVSDVDPARLSNLANLIEQAQQGISQPAR